jgi:hypothetical protein
MTSSPRQYGASRAHCCLCAAINADGRTGVTGDNPSDMALSQNSQYLYVRIGRTDSIDAFAVQGDGSRQPLAGASGLPANSAGLIAR